METPICVTDAQTFVEHIHQIKKWIYDGQLRLIIPSGFSENVELLYKKSLEPKSIPKEAPKSKVFGKPAKKEYPAFDANPKAAREYLARIQAGKNYETGINGRAIYEDLENHEAVHFVKPSEQYSAWKELEDYEEKPEVSAGSESWADKLRRKQIVMNEQNENKTKGPVKPKLVAKTGADNSPWKVQKNAPTISGLEVPVALRPTMSFCLWRIHESIHRNDENQVFLMTSGPSVKTVAQKLHVNVRSPAELHKVVKTPSPQADLNTFGKLEEEFGVRPVKERRVIKCTAVKGTPPNLRPVGQVNGAVGESTSLEVPKNEENVPAKPRPQWIRQSSGLGKPMDRYNDRSLKKAQSSGALRKKEDQPPSTAKQSAVNGLMDKIRQISGSAAGTPTLQKQTLGTDQFANGIKQVSRPVQEPQTIENKSVQEEKPPKEVLAQPTQDTLQSTNAWTRSWAEMLSGEQGRKSSPVPEPKALATVDTREEPVNALPVKVDGSHGASREPAGKEQTELSTAMQPLPRAPSIADAASSSLDSDEEIVVFKPKQNRLSAQKKPMKQASRPTTPNDQARIIPNTAVQPSMNQTPQISGQDVNKKQTTPKVTPRQRHTPKQHNDVNGGRNVGRPLAPVIDPDAFGRDFAVNTHANKGSIRGPRVRHSPQPSLFDAGVNSSRPTSSHRQHRRSPSRVSPKPSPPQTTKVPAETLTPTAELQALQTPPTSAPRGPSSSHRKQLPIGHGRPSVSPAHSSPPQRVVTMSPLPSFSPSPAVATLNANAPVFQPGGMGNSFLQAAFQPEFGTPKSNPPIQPPIGSGRPSSKTSQQKDVEPADSPASSVNGFVDTVQEPVEPSPVSLRNMDVVPPKGPRNTDPSFSRRPTHPRQNMPQGPATASDAEQMSSVPSNPHRFSNRPPFRNGDFQRGRGGRPGVNVRRPVKPILFEPDLDHTRAFQPDVVEPKKSVQPDVQYVLKSGTTREEARGKGRLWVG